MYFLSFLTNFRGPCATCWRKSVGQVCALKCVTCYEHQTDHALCPARCVGQSPRTLFMRCPVAVLSRVDRGAIYVAHWLLMKCLKLPSWWALGNDNQKEPVFTNNNHNKNNAIAGEACIGNTAGSMHPE